MSRPLPTPHEYESSGLQKNRPVRGPNPIPPIAIRPPESLGELAQSEWTRLAKVQQDLHERDGSHWLTDIHAPLLLDYCLLCEDHALAALSVEEWRERMVQRERDHGAKKRDISPATRLYRTRDDGDGGEEYVLHSLINARNRAGKRMRDAARDLMLLPAANQRLNLVMFNEVKLAIGDSKGRLLNPG